MKKTRIKGVGDEGEERKQREYKVRSKILTNPTRKSGPPQKVDQCFRNFSGWTEQIH